MGVLSALKARKIKAVEEFFQRNIASICRIACPSVRPYNQHLPSSRFLFRVYRDDVDYLPANKLNSRLERGGPSAARRGRQLAIGVPIRRNRAFLDA